MRLMFDIGKHRWTFVPWPNKHDLQQSFLKFQISSGRNKVRTWIWNLLWKEKKLPQSISTTFQNVFAIKHKILPHWQGILSRWCYYCSCCLIEGKHKNGGGSFDKRGIAVKCQFETYESMGNEYQLRILKSKKRFNESNLFKIRAPANDSSDSNISHNLSKSTKSTVGFKKM